MDKINDPLIKWMRTFSIPELESVISVTKRRIVEWEKDDTFDLLRVARRSLKRMEGLLEEKKSEAKDKDSNI